MNPMSNDGEAFTELRKHWIEASKKEKDWRDAGEVALLDRLQDAYNGLKVCGWKEIIYCPKDGTLFLGIEAGCTGVYPYYYQGEWPKGSWWCQAHGDLWPARPILWKAMPEEFR